MIVVTNRICVKGMGKKWPQCLPKKALFKALMVLKS